MNKLKLAALSATISEMYIKVIGPKANSKRNMNKQNSAKRN
jgi:hypothetical protein